MELDANAGNQTLKLSVSSEHRYRSEISFKKNEIKRFLQENTDGGEVSQNTHPLRGFWPIGAVSDISRTLVSPRSFLVLISCASESHPASSTAYCVPDKGLFPSSCETLPKLL